MNDELETLQKAGVVLAGLSGYADAILDVAQYIERHGTVGLTEELRRLNRANHAKAKALNIGGSIAI